MILHACAVNMRGAWSSCILNEELPWMRTFAWWRSYRLRQQTVGTAPASWREIVWPTDLDSLWVVKTRLSNVDFPPANPVIPRDHAMTSIPQAAPRGSGPTSKASFQPDARTSTWRCASCKGGDFIPGLLKQRWIQVIGAPQTLYRWLRFAT